MNKHNNMETLKKAAKNWYKRGIGGFRSSEEIDAFIAGAEETALNSWESAGITSMAVYNAHNVMSELEDFFYELKYGKDEA